MSQILIAQRAYGAGRPAPAAITSAARIAQDKSRDAARTKAEAVALAKPSTQVFGQVLAGILARRGR